jgi:hypothetical protein
MSSTPTRNCPGRHDRHLQQCDSQHFAAQPQLGAAAQLGAAQEGAAHDGAAQLGAAHDGAAHPREADFVQHDDAQHLWLNIAARIGKRGPHFLQRLLAQQLGAAEQLGAAQQLRAAQQAGRAQQPTCAGLPPDLPSAFKKSSSRGGIGACGSSSAVLLVVRASTW